MASDVQCSFKRCEKKYLLTQLQYYKMKTGMAQFMEADRYSNYTICNLYYDTPDFQLIRTSLEKPVYKEKLRTRSYGVAADDSSVFVELKKKFDGVVYKRRVVMNANDATCFLEGEAVPGTDSQIHREIDWFRRSYPDLQPRVFIGYDREAYAGIENSELRITFDTGLRGRTDNLDLRLGDYGSPLLPPGRVLMEIKIPGAAPLWLSHLLSENGIFSSSFSKYGAYYKQYILGSDPAVEEVRNCA